jgi:hypothetical protein
MKRRILAAGCLLAALLPGEAVAGSYAEALGRCAIQATSPPDRAVLIRWMFVAAATNPALSDLVTISAEAREQNARAVGALINRILLRACRQETVVAIRHEGRTGIQGAFQALGQLAGMEMMLAPQAQAALQGVDPYIDNSGLEAIGREAAMRPPT